LAYPPSTLPVNRTNASAVTDNHPGDHNNVNQAVNDIVATLGPNPQGAQATVQARFGIMPALIAWRYGRTSSLTLNANGGAMSIPNFVTATMVAGHIYMLQQTARAIGSQGAYGILQRDSVNYTDPNTGGGVDWYAGASAQSYGMINVCFLLMGSAAGNVGSHSWRIGWTSETASTNSYFDNAGNFMAMWDLGLDPGSQ
jgi:hypothetical protein